MGRTKKLVKHFRYNGVEGSAADLAEHFGFKRANTIFNKVAQDRAIVVPQQFPVENMFDIFRNNLLKELHHRNISAREFSLSCGLGPQSVTKFLSGQTQTNLPTLNSIVCNGLGYAPEEAYQLFLTDTEKELLGF